MGSQASSVDEHELFLHLAVGLAQLSRQGFSHALPKSLRRALDGLWALAIEQGKGTPILPSSLIKTLQLFQEPVRIWWPGSIHAIPDDIDPDLPLLWDAFAVGQGNVALHEQVLDFLLENDLLRQRDLSLQDIQAIHDQQAMEKLVRWARDNPESRQQDYVTIRRFLIMHPWTTVRQLRQALQGVVVDQRLIIDMYETANAFHSLAFYQGHYWQCPHCRGILSWINGRPRCAKKICGELFIGYQPRDPLNPDTEGLLRLKWVNHARICLPGKPEMALFEWLEQQRTLFSALQKVELWPGADRYDLRLTFNDAIWGVDVKDYVRAITLSKKIGGHSLDDADGAVPYDRGFYVVPRYRASIPGYMSFLRGISFPMGIELLDEDAFREVVLWKMQHS